MVKHTLRILRVHTAIFLKYVWPFYNIMHERVNLMASQVDFCHIDQPPSKKGEVVYRRNKNSVGESISQSSYIIRKNSQSSTGFSKNFMVTITLVRIKKTTLNKMRTTLIMLTYFQLK